MRESAEFWSEAMTNRELRKSLSVGAAIMSLTGCGGGGGMSFIPAPVAQPTPAGPLPPAQIGLVSTEPFAVLGTGDTFTTDPSGQNVKPLTAPSAQDVQFSYDASTNSYTVSIPGFQPGTLVNPAYNGSSGQPATSSFSRVTAGASPNLQDLSIFLQVPGNSFSPYTYTSFGTWTGTSGTTGSGDIIRSEGSFAYGIATKAGDVPITGSAIYSADIRGTTETPGFNLVGGNARLSFDFAAGTLSGFMHPSVNDGFDGIHIDFGQYDFTQTVYSTGGTTFSGKFVVPGLPNANSSFQGNFTGPSAAELMARFQAPYVLDGHEGTVAGTWIGKKN